MARYSIRELEKLSGIKAHTIRIWEKRYRIISPHRTETNIRYYSDEDVKRIISISLLNNSGTKISKIASLSPHELVDRVTKLSERQVAGEVHVDQLIVAMIDLEEENFETLLNDLIRRYGFEITITDIIYPFLEKIGVLWLTGNITPVQEHFISNLLRQKLLVAIDALPLAGKSRPRVLLFLPDEELHELGLLFYYFIVKKAGFCTYYLGQRVPYEDLKFFDKSHKPAIMIISITTSPSSHFVQDYLNRLCGDSPDTTILATGPMVRKISLKIPSNLHLFQNVAELKVLLEANQSA